MDEMSKDARFAHIAKDPKFRRIPKDERKVKIDHRFKDMFKDKKFSVKYTIDKRGRPINQTTTEDLKKYYDLSSSEDEDKDTLVSFTSRKDEKKNKAKDIKEKAKNKKKAIKQVDSTKDFSHKESKSNQADNNYTLNDKDMLQNSSKKEFAFVNESDNESLYNDDEDTLFEKEISQLDLDENDKQLYERRKDEKSKLTNEVKEKLKDLTVNYARGEGILFTDSSSEEESSEPSDEEEIEHNWGELDKEAETTDEITHRLAICNMDWDRIRAVDLMILLNSFLPSGGFIHSVMIYPSEFGQQRMKEEEINGPTELKNNENIGNEDDIEDDNEEGSNYHMEKLRQYQLNRLKYYYAVAEFNSAETANKVYMECDGIEYESTATRLDLRFIPDDMTFDQEPKEICTEISEPVKYQPRQFTTTALQQVKVQLTWDETNLDRQEFTQKLNSGKLQDIDENYLQTYLASGSENDSDTEKEKEVTKEVNDDQESERDNDSIGKYKSLLKTIEEEEEAKKNKDVELEFTWGIGTKEKAEKFVKENIKNKEELTPFEQYLEKRKAKKKAKKEERKKLREKDQSDSKDSLLANVDINDKYFTEEFKNDKLSCRKEKMNKETSDVESLIEQEEKRRKAELELLLMDQEDDKKHFNMKQIEENANMSKSKRKRLSKKKNVQEATKKDDFEVDVKDQRFAALFTSHHFNIDPADSHYKKTKGTATIINEKLKRKFDETHTEDDKQVKKPRASDKLSTELHALVKSVKNKTQNIKHPIKG